MPLPNEFKGAEIGWNDMSLSQSIRNFSVYNLPDYDNAPEPYIGHIFMSRPSLEICANDNANLKRMQKLANMHGVLTDEQGAALAASLDRQCDQKWIPLVTTRAKNYSVNDFELKTVEKGATFYGHMMTYAKHSEEHKIGGTVTIDFRNDRFRSIFNLMYIWMFYIYNVSKNDNIKVFREHEEKAILDYCGSLYYIVTKRDNRRIVYWEKLVGIRPKKLPFSMYSWDDTPKVEDTVSVDFEYGVRCDPMDPSILVDINALNREVSSPAAAERFVMQYEHYAGNTRYVNYDLQDQIVRPKVNPFLVSNNFSVGPIITAIKDKDRGTIEYYLEFINKTR